MTHEQEIAWVRRYVRGSGGEVVIFWGLMVFFWAAVFLVHAISNPNPFHFESVIVSCLYLSVFGLVRSYQAKRLRIALHTLLGESWER